MAEQAPPTSLSSPLLPDFHVSVVVEGKPAPLYAVKEGGNKVTCFVESKEGASFEVHYRDERRNPPSHAYSTDCYIDGRRADGLYARLTDPKFGRPRGDKLRVSKVTGKLSTTDQDELACADEKVVKGMGTIRLQYHRLKSVGEPHARKTAVPPAAAVLHEASKKAQLSHQSKLGAERAVANVITCTTVRLDPKDSPLVSFEFVYRSRALLEIQDLIPVVPIDEPAIRLSASAPLSPEPAPVPAINALATASVASGPGGKKRLAEITIASDSEDENEATELQRLRARVAELERERIKTEPGADVKTKVKAEKEEKPVFPDLKRLKREQAESNR